MLGDGWWSCLASVVGCLAFLVLYARCWLVVLPWTGELDLPRGAMSTNGPRMTLPAPSERHAVLLQDRAGAQRMVLSMNRMPFWLVDTAGSQQAVVMYVAS